MRVAIVEVGSNTARLLVAAVGRDGALEPLARQKVFLGLGAEIAATGTLSPETVARTASVCSDFATRAREASVERAEVIVTAPGRQGGATGLVSALRAGTGLHVRTLTADDEGRLAFEGAVARADRNLPDRVAVVDVGGGSTEVVVGPPSQAQWVRSVDLGSLRLTRLALPNDPPSKREVAAARTLVRDSGVSPARDDPPTRDAPWRLMPSIDNPRSCPSHMRSSGATFRIANASPMTPSRRSAVR